jgi:hypothetical protein
VPPARHSTGRPWRRATGVATTQLKGWAATTASISCSSITRSSVRATRLAQIT